MQCGRKVMKCESSISLFSAEAVHPQHFDEAGGHECERIQVGQQQWLPRCHCGRGSSLFL